HGRDGSGDAACWDGDDHAGGQRGDGRGADHADCDGGEAAVCNPRGRQDRGRRRGGVDHGIGPTTGFRGDERTLVLSLVTCMIAPSPVSVFRLAMVLPFMHLQPCGGPRGRRKRFRRSVAQWLEHRSPNSASAIPPNSIACHLINNFGPKTHSQARPSTGPFHRVPSNWVAKW